MKSLLAKTVVQHIAADCRKPDQIGAGFRPEMKVSPPGHFMPSHIGHDQLLAAKFMRPFDSSRQHRMTLRRVRPDDDDQTGALEIFNRTAVPPVTTVLNKPMVAGDWQ